MRRRFVGLVVLPALLAALLLPAGSAAASPDPADATLVLAVEGGEEPVGPEPRGPRDTENPAAPPPYEANFLWGAAVGLLFLLVVGLAALASLYYLLVVRPRSREEAQRR